MRRGLPALLLLVALLLVAGCGGNEIAADEVPGSPPTLSLPPDEAPAAADSANDSSNQDEAPTDEEADTGASTGSDTGAATDTGTTPAPAATAAPDTGGAAPEATAAPDTGGAGGDESQFEDFCNQNPGAC